MWIVIPIRTIKLVQVDTFINNKRNWITSHSAASAVFVCVNYTLKIEILLLCLRNTGLKEYPEMLPTRHSKTFSRQ